MGNKRFRYGECHRSLNRDDTDEQGTLPVTFAVASGGAPGPSGGHARAGWAASSR